MGGTEFSTQCPDVVGNKQGVCAGAYKDGLVKAGGGSWSCLKTEPCQESWEYLVATTAHVWVIQGPRTGKVWLLPRVWETEEAAEARGAGKNLEVSGGCSLEVLGKPCQEAMWV